MRFIFRTQTSAIAQPQLCSTREPIDCQRTKVSDSWSQWSEPNAKKARGPSTKLPSPSTHQYSQGREEVVRFGARVGARQRVAHHSGRRPGDAGEPSAPLGGSVRSAAAPARRGVCSRGSQTGQRPDRRIGSLGADRLRFGAGHTGGTLRRNLRSRASGSQAVLGTSRRSACKAPRALPAAICLPWECCCFRCSAAPYRTRVPCTAAFPQTRFGARFVSGLRTSPRGRDRS